MTNDTLMDMQDIFNDHLNKKDTKELEVVKQSRKVLSSVNSLSDITPIEAAV